MTALDRWQQQIRMCREERGEPDSEAWQRTAGWYNAWVEHNDYTAIVLSRLQRFTSSRLRILEIGPGSGGFTIPLAEKAREIVAVEPSQGMRAVLAQNLAEAGIGNVRVQPARIEKILGEIDGPFDLALAAYSFYNILSIDTVIQTLVSQAGLTVAAMGTGEIEGWYRSLYHHFRGRPPVAPPQVQYFYPVLQEMGLDARVEVVQTSSNYVYPDEESMLDHWAWRLRIEPSRRAELRAMLLALEERRNGHVGIYGQRHTALVWIRQGGTVARAISEIGSSQSR